MKIAKITTWAFVSGLVSFVLFFFLHLSRSDKCVGINTAANTWEQCQTMCDVMKKDKGSLWVQRQHKVQCFLFYLQFLDLLLSLTAIHSLPPPSLLLSLPGPAMCWINTKWQNSRACRSLCMCVVVCVCVRVCVPVNVWMWDLAYHRDMSHPSLLPSFCLLYPAHLFW